MSHWRFFGELSQVRTPEEMRTQSLYGWNPWQHPWIPCEGGSAIVVRDPFDSKRSLHVLTYRVTHGNIIKFAVDQRTGGVWRFFVPAAPSDDGAFEARTPRYEGFWRSRLHSDQNLPWPEAEEGWPERAEFLKMLDHAEAEAEKVAYRGYSQCRICGCRNGSQSFRLDVWEWPSGYCHYLAEHEVRPSRDFELFIRDRTNDA